MKNILFIIAFLFALCWLHVPMSYATTTARYVYHDTIPVSLPASFTDDYGIRYTVSDTLWLQHPSAKYHILRWNLAEQYVIARNGMDNKTEKGLYTRIDYMKFNNMEPYKWGFCLSTYNAASDSLAEFAPTKTDRANPRKGCNGFPFSRMKKVE